MKNFRIKNKFFIWFKITVSIGLISYLIFLVDWNRAFALLAVTDWFYLTIGALLWFLGLFFTSLRWHLILKDNKVDFSIFQAYKGYLRGMFYNIFLPGSIGGDMIRVGICAFQSKCKLGTATASVLLERTAGIFSLFIFLFVVYFIFFEEFSPIFNIGFSRYLLIGGLVFVIFIVMSVLVRNKLINCFPHGKLNKVFLFFRVGIGTLSSLSGKTLLMVLILSGFSQAVDILACFLFSKAIGIGLSLPVFFGVIPLVYLVIVLPISLGGLGVREGILVFLLSMFGIGTTEAITLSFIIYIDRIFYGTIGGLVEFMEAFKVKRVAKTAK